MLSWVYLRTIVAAVHGFVTDLPPKVALESARRCVGTNSDPPANRWKAGSHKSKKVGKRG